MSLAAVALCAVLSVHDGDSMRVRCEGAGGPTLALRVAQIDAPELDQVGGRESRRWLAALCLGHWAQVTPRGRDRFGRTVAAVACGGQDVAQWQVSAGWAWAVARYGATPALMALQEAAMADGVGLWAQGHDAVPPWLWRRAARAR